MVAVTRLNHAVLYVRDLARSLTFYQSLFEFEEVDRIQNQVAFLRAKGSDNHHDLGLIAIGSDAPLASPGSVRLYHLAWEVATIADLAQAAEILQNRGDYLGASDHQVSKSIYGRDPDGYEFEIMWRVPRELWGEFEHRAVVAPLNLQRELEQFGQL